MASSYYQASSEKNLSYHDISFHFKYEGNWEELKAFLKKRLPVACLASLRHDVAIDIENGDKVIGNVDSLLAQFKIMGRRTIGLFGYYSIIMSSRLRLTATEFIVRSWDQIAGVLDPHNIDRANDARFFLVIPTEDSARVLQDGTTRSLARIVDEYCQNRLHENAVVPVHLVDRRTSRAYVKRSDKSYKPEYQVPIAQYTGLPTAICEVSMSDVVSKVIFDCLTSFVGTKGKVDLALGVDLAINNQGLTKIRLFVFDATITTLERFSQDASVVRVLKGKVDYRLDQLRRLRSHLHQDPILEVYERFEPQINDSIRYYERILRNLPGINGEVSDRDVVRTCEILMERAQVINMTWINGRFAVTGIHGEELNGVVLKTEAFLGLVGFQEDLVLDVGTLRQTYLHIALVFINDALEDTWSPIPLILTKRHISNQRYQEFVISHGLDSNQAFRDGQAVTVQNVKLGHLSEDSVITPAAKAYLDLDEEEDLRSIALKISCALYWFREKKKKGLEVYDLADLDSRAGEQTTSLDDQNASLPQ